jgi:hypothetical protein
MNYQNAEVTLTVKTEGPIALRGKYESSPKVDENGKPVFSIEKNDKGEIVKDPVYAVKTIQLPKFNEASHSTTLNNSFVKWAISDDGKPRKVSATHWKNLTPKMKLQYHIKQYVVDLYGQAEFEYTILE